MTLCGSSFSSSKQIFEQWKSLFDKPSSSIEIINFFNNYPDFPKLALILRKMEENLKGIEPKNVLCKWFEKYPPNTPRGVLMYGKLILADKALLQKKRQELPKLIVSTWINQNFDKKDYRDFFITFRSFLKLKDHMERTNRLLYNEKLDQISPMLSHLSQTQQYYVKKRISLIESSKNQTCSRISAVNTASLTFEKIRYHRRKQEINNVLSLFKNTSREIKEEEKKYPEFWWIERRWLIFRLLALKEYQEAFDIAKNHQLKEGELFLHAEWLKGWLSLRFLNKCADARQIFLKLYKKVERPISKSRIAFWLGETFKILNKKQQAIYYYKKASEHPTTFYGQTACVKLKEIKQTIPSFKLEKTTIPLSTKKQLFKSPLVKIIQYGGKDIKNDNYIFPLFIHLSQKANNINEKKAITVLAKEYGHQYYSVWISKSIIKTKAFHFVENFPTLSTYLLRAVKRIVKKDVLLCSLVHAIIRRESCFHDKIASPANAYGLMQLIRPTAQAERRHAVSRFPYRLPLRLDLYNPFQNVVLGTSHIIRLLEKFDGNIVLALAAYNAGAHNVQKWIDQLGLPKADDIDWIEMIPFSETRNYVQRVLEDFWVYIHIFSSSKKVSPVYKISHSI
ncbi:MAG: transglycosylase SLT domain-containing protein [Alphaproteobacteria bacterium]